MMRCISPLGSTAAATATAALPGTEFTHTAPTGIVYSVTQSSSVPSSPTPYADYWARKTLLASPIIRRQMSKPSGSIRQLCSDSELTCQIIKRTATCTCNNLYVLTICKLIKQRGRRLLIWYWCAIRPALLYSARRTAEILPARMST